MRRVMIFALLCAVAVHAETFRARLGSLGRNDMVVTDVVSDGVPPRALSVGIDTRWQDATGCVWQVSGGELVLTNAWTGGPAGTLTWHESESNPYGVWESLDGYDMLSYADGLWTCSSGTWMNTYVGPGAVDAMNLTLTNVYSVGDAQIMQLSRIVELVIVTNLLGRVALSSDVAASTNGLPEAVAAKQAALPYPTNAIPYSAIADAPSGAPEWVVVAIDHVAWTNGMLEVTFASTLSAVTNGWPDGAAVFCRLHPPVEYTVDPMLRLVGYGMWPTNAVQAVAWRSGTNVFVNVLLEETP